MQMKGISESLNVLVGRKPDFSDTEIDKEIISLKSKVFTQVN